MARLRVVVTAIGLLVAAGCDNGRDTLLANLQSTRPEERALAVKKLADKARPEDLVLFTSAAKDPASIVRAEAARALGKSQDERVVDLLGDLLGDDSDEVQANAAMALAEIRTEKAKAYLTSQYSRRGRSTRFAIVQALKAANVPGAMAGVVSAEARSIWDRNLKALTGGTLPEQVAAAEELGKSGRAEAVTRLIGLLKDQQVMFAAAAVRGLGFAGDRRAVQPITELLNENYPELRESACEALRRLQDPSALPKLLEIALEKSAVSSTATAAIGALPRSPEADKALCAITLDGAADDSSSAGTEMKARGGCPNELLTERWGKQGGQAAVLQASIALGAGAKDWLPKLLPLLSSSDAQSRLLAVRAVGAIGDPSAAPPLQKLFDQETKSVQALRAKWIPAALPTQFAEGFTENGPAPQEGAADQKGAESKNRYNELWRRLADLNKSRGNVKKGAETHPPTELIDDTTDEQLVLYAALLSALGEVNAPGASELLKANATDASPAVRQAAFIGLAHLGPDALSDANAGLVDPDREVQGRVAEELARQGEAGQLLVVKTALEFGGDKLPLLEPLLETGAPASAAPQLIELLKDGGAEAGLAARLLGDAKAKDAVDPLIKYLQDPNAVGRREALVALGHVGDSRAAETVGKDLYSDSADVRAAAAEALGNIGTSAQAEPLDALKGDYYRRVRELTEGALAHVAATPAPPEAKK